MAKKNYSDPFARHDNETEALSNALYGKVNVPDTGRPTWRDGILNVGAFRCTSTGISLPEGVQPSDRDMRTLGDTLRYMQGSLQWLIGDYANAAEHLRWGDLADLAEHLGVEYGTLRTYMHVCRSVNLSIRIDKLSFAHHQLIVAFPPDQQRDALSYALENKLSVAAFRAWLSPQRQIAAPSAPLTYLESVKRAEKLLSARYLTNDQRRELASYADTLASLIASIQAKLKDAR